MKMLNLFKKVKEKLTMGFCLFLVCGSALASNPNAGGAGKVGRNIAENVYGLTEAALAIAAFVGLLIHIWGWLKIREGQNTQTTKGQALLAIFVGAALFSVMALIIMFNVSAFDTDTTEQQRGRIIGTR